MNVYAKFRCAPLRIKKPQGLLDPGELIPTTRTRTTRVGSLGPAFRVQKQQVENLRF